MTSEIISGHVRLIPWFENVLSDYQKKYSEKRNFLDQGTRISSSGMTIEVFPGHLRLIPWFEKVISDYQKDNPKSAPFSIKEPESVVPGWPLKFSRDICVWFLDLKMLFRIIKKIIRKAHLSRSRNQNQWFRNDQWNYFGTSASYSLIWKSYFGLSKR